jgi:DeoR family suf operon transcriptional repressor
VPGPDSTSLATLPPTRRALLTALKKAGEARADDVASALGITVSAVRQHVAGLAADGLVEHREVRAGPGRPHHLYRLSEQGDRLFPRAYGSIVLDLLEEVEDEDPAMLDRLFERRRKRRVEGAKARLARLLQRGEQRPPRRRQRGEAGAVGPGHPTSLRVCTAIDPQTSAPSRSGVTHRG